jgi:peptidoglycan/xylan/chitin deacetylase (PgdA/CDA1 family)
MHKRNLGFLVLASVLFINFFSVHAASAQVSNLIANPSVEAQQSATVPASWSSNKWGTTVATFTYPTGGAQEGTRYVKTQVTTKGTGDAKWYPSHITVTPGATYTFSNYYQSNVQSFVEVEYLLTTGAYQYVRIATLPSAASWALNQKTFVAPANAKTATILHFIQAVGTLSTDNYVLSTGSTPPPPPPPPPAGNNLILNPSVETASGVVPASWVSGKWGTTAATFTYPTGGAQDGTRYVKTQITTAGTGDAKWSPNHITATPGKTYNFSNYYQSNVQSFVEVEYQLTNNAYQYVRLATLPAAAGWTLYQKSFTAPANAKSVTVLHFIQAVGTLSVDNYSLTDGTVTPPPPPPPASNLVLNPSVETENGTLPANWSTQAWGTNNAAFTYVKNAGHTGNHSAKVNITTYTDGDAKWVPVTLDVTPGDSYRFSDWYQSDVETYVVVDFTNVDDSHYYLGFRPAAPSASWKQFTDAFSVPYNAKSMTIYHLLLGVGSLTVDDYSLTKITPQGFSRGIVTMAFDDGWEEDVFTVLPVLKTYGFHATFFFATTFLESTPPTGPINISGPAAIHAMQADGHEIGGHSVTHPDLTSLSQTDLDYELGHSKTYLESVAGAGQVKNLATPFGTYNDQVINTAKPLYQSLRSTDEGFNSPESFDQYRLVVQNMQQTTTLAEFQSWIDQAKKDKSWLVLVYHRVATSSLEQFDTPQANFVPQMEYIKNSGVTVLTTEQALQEVLPQMGL